MAELSQGTIPLTPQEIASLATIPNVLGYSRVDPDEKGAIQVETADGQFFLIEPDGTIQEI